MNQRATYCSPCDARVASVQTREDPRIWAMFEYESDGFTLSPDRHICWPRAERIGRLIMQRRVRLDAPHERRGDHCHTCSKARCEVVPWPCPTELARQGP